MAKPIPGALKEITPEPPQPYRMPESTADVDGDPQRDPMPDAVLDLTPDEPYDATSEPEPVLESAPEPEPERQAEPQPELDFGPQPDSEPLEQLQPEAEPAPEPTSQVSAANEPVAESEAADDVQLPTTARETMRAVDESWRAFHSMAARFPAERMDERLTEDGWTRKQMLAHVAAWHDLTADRLLKFINTGQPPEFKQDADQFNAIVARRAIGRTAGEIMNDTEATFNRLRRQVQRLTDQQLRQFDQWAAWVIRANTYGHYEEHRQDVYLPEPPPGAARR